MKKILTQIEKETMTDIYLELLDICKYYYTDDGVVIKANDNVNFNLRKGEIHALLGENGAGKSTLVRNLTRRPDSGKIILDGKEITIDSPIDSMKYGIGISHQDLSKSLIERHSVAENILSVAEGKLFSAVRVSEKIKSTIKKYNLDNIDPNMKIWKLSGGEKQRVEILKAIITDPDILILDEPTSMLTPVETEKLFTLTKSLKAQGKSVIIITHHLDEAINECDRITVMRQGKVVESLDEKQVNTYREDPKAGVRALANLMVGREVIYEYDLSKKVPEKTGLVNINKISVDNDMGDEVLRGVDLVINTYEILGLAGIAGNGQQQLVEAILNLRPKKSGVVSLRGEDISKASVKQIRNRGIAYIPEDRRKALVAQLSIKQNMILNSYDKNNGMFVNSEEVTNLTDKLMEQYAIKAPNSLAPISSLSGGNKQKVVVARELSLEHSSKSNLFVIAENPTFGLDVQTTQFVRQQLVNKKEEGAGILLVSSDLTEILAISDYIAVIYKGRIMGHMSRENATKHDIGLMMGGVNPYEKTPEEES